MDTINDHVQRAEEEKLYDPGKFAKRIFFKSLLIRLIVLGIVLMLWPVVSEFIISDDATMDRFASFYLSMAKSPIDLSAFASSLIGIGGQSSYHAWYWVIAVLTYIFKNTVAIRFLNVILSSIASVLVYYLCIENQIDIVASERASKLYAYMPYPVLFCCFEIKDVLFTVLVLALWIILVRIHRDNKWTAVRILALLALIPVIRNIRGGVFEVILFVFVITYIPRAYENRKYFQLCLILAVASVSAILFGQSVSEVFMQKISWYSVYNRVEGTISAFRIDSLTQLYKLPLAYLWSFVQPLMSPSTFESTEWLRVLSILNLTAVPIMIWNVIYFIRRNKNWLYWSTLALHLASVILSLGTFRHYFFMIPYMYINSSISQNSSGKSEITAVVIGSMLMCLLIVAYTMLGT